LAASTAHDIRNILSSLSLLVTPGFGEPAEALAKVREQLDRFSVLAHRLMSYAAPSSKSTGEIDLVEVLQRVVSLTGGQAAVSRVRVSIQPTPLVVIGDGHQLEHLFVNLVLNAIQAMEPGGGDLCLTMLRERNDAVVKVTDNGPGLDKGARLFEPFTTSKPTGTGLGLFSCRRIVEDHGGSISARSHRGGGTTFTVRIPLKSP
jgi:signal transduction histidine kinase